MSKLRTRIGSGLRHRVTWGVGVPAAVVNGFIVGTGTDNLAYGVLWALVVWVAVLFAVSYQLIVD